MSKITRWFLAVAALVAVALPVAASAYTVPNLVALATPDHQVAVTYAGFATPATLANAGAFASMAKSYGLIGIPSFDPVTVSGSTLVCQSPKPYSDELIAVYGLPGQGIDEAIDVCAAFQQSGMYVQWR